MAALLATPSRTSRTSRTGWGAALTLGVGALLPAALAPAGAHQGAAPARPSRPFRATALAQDAAPATVAASGAVAPAARPLDRAGLRFAEGPWGQGTGDGSAVLWPVPVPGATGWFSPAPGARISQLFGVPDSEYAAGYHTGVDFAVLTGTPLLAVAPATVETAGWGGAYGNWIVLRLPDGHYALYAHMSRLDVHAGQHVAAGQQLGLSGDTGHTTGPHLHFEIRTRNSYGAVVDPLPYLQAHGCRF